MIMVWLSGPNKGSYSVLKDLKAGWDSLALAGNPSSAGASKSIREGIPCLKPMCPHKYG